jgi:3'-phosphoadenosine 5'-phosphosulfate sulfotransferase (PAPS reductase)/FAD synthetase
LKLAPIRKYLRENYNAEDVAVVGIRKSESKFRDLYYKSTFFIRKYDDVEVKVWAPLLHVSDATLNNLIEWFGIPKSPVWRFGFSGECLCLAGAPIHEIAIILRRFPEMRDTLLEIDNLINQRRRQRPSAPFRISQAGYRTLREFYRQVVKSQMTLDDFVLPYKSCEGSCML